MVDPATVTNAFGYLKAAKEALANYKNLSDKTEAAEVINTAVQKVGDAQGALVDVQAAMFDLQRENEELKRNQNDDRLWQDKIAGFTLSKTEGGAMVYAAPGDSYYACPSCVNKREIVPLQDCGTATGAYKCTSCDAFYPIEKVERPAPPSDIFGSFVV